MGEVIIVYGSNYYKDITLEVRTQNKNCHDRLCILAGTTIEDYTSFVSVQGLKLLIGFKDEAALNASRAYLYDVLSDFSGEFEATFWNAL